MTVFRFGDFEADDSKFELRRDGQVVRVQRIVLETILFLIKGQGRAVSKSDLLRGPWRGHQVSDAAVSRAVMLARRALDDTSGRVLSTVHGVGYRFLAPIAESSFEPGSPVQAVNVTAFREAPGIGVDDPPSSVRCTTRLTELSTLQRALDKSRRGRGRLVLIKGGAGVGKTTLVEHFAELCGARGITVAWGRAWSSQFAPPLWHWLEVARSCRDWLKTSERRDCQPLGRDWARLTGTLERFSKTPGQREQLLNVLDAVTRSLDQLSRAQPLVVALEGLQDADETSLHLLDFLRQRLGQMPLLVIATSRPRSVAPAGALALDEGAPHLQVLDLLPR